MHLTAYSPYSLWGDTTTVSGDSPYTVRGGQYISRDIHPTVFGQFGLAVTH